MTDRVDGLMVVLMRPTRVDDLRDLITAIRQMHNVSDVITGDIVDPGANLARISERQAIARELDEKLSEIFNRKETK